MTLGEFRAHLEKAIHDGIVSMEQMSADGRYMNIAFTAVEISCMCRIADGLSAVREL